MTLTGDEHILFNNDFPRSNSYDPHWVLENSMGPNVLWLTEWLCGSLQLEPDMKVLDLGSGRALSSVFLAREFGVRVWSYDLWVDPTDNLRRVRQQGLDRVVYPLRGDARDLPFAEGFFDAIVCVDAYIYFGTDDLYLNYLQKYLAAGGQLGIVVPGLMKEFEDGVPEHLEGFWGQDCWSWHTLEWWRLLWARTGLVDITTADTMPDGCQMYVRWKQAQDEVGKNPWPQDTAILQADGGEYVGFIRLVGQKPIP